WSLTSSSGSRGQRLRYHTLYACEGNSLEITCEEGTHINLIRANFGRFSISVCNEQGNVDWSVNCMAHRSFRVIQERCGGRSTCRIEATVATFNEDACPKVHKYLEVHYNCTKPRILTPSSQSKISSSLLPSISASSLSQSNQSDNHNYGELPNNNYHHPQHHHDVSLTPVVLFPEPLSPSINGGDIDHHHLHGSTSTSTSLPPHIDLTSQDIKDQEEAPDSYDPSYSDNDSSYTSQPDDVLLVPVPVPVPSIDLVYDYCRPMYAKNLNWNWTMAGSVLRQACPAGAKGVARWSCIIENGEPTWTPVLPDMSNCSSLWITHLLERLSSQESIFSLAEELAKGAKGKILYSGDLISAADIIKQLVIRLETKLEESKDDQDRRAHLIKELLNSVLNVASNLLEEIQIESWHELNPHDQRLALRTMVRALERVAELLADVRSQPNYNFVQTHNNIC
ncbi:Galactose binding lectin domain containing protein 2, partial [Sarcoptes scabiei]